MGDEGGLPAVYALGQNYPNPFDQKTEIKFKLNSRDFVVLKIYDELGREIATPVNGEIEEGEHSVEFDATAFAPGVYYYTIWMSEGSETKAMIYFP